MKILVAGATGALGRQLVPLLVARGHVVTGMTRSEGKRDLVRAMGAQPAVVDALDPDAVGDAVALHEPDVIVHQLTALSGPLDLRNMDRTFAETNRLRTEATDHLLAAGRAAGIKRFVAQSFAGWPVDAAPAASMRESLRAIRYVEEAVTGADWTEGIALRYGGFYGPGTSLAPEGGVQIDAIRKRQFPIVGSGAGVLAFIHVEDAAEATAIAIERGRRGIYEIVDDAEEPVRTWLPTVADALGAKPPRHVPRWVGRLVAGPAATFMMTEMRATSNAKAKRELGWSPSHPSLTETVARWAA
jgi:nucleoside-diphosphate-sugar epimerase